MDRRLEASELITEAASRARAVALPSLARAREGSIRRWSEIDPDVKEQVALSLLTSAAVAAGEHLKEHERPGVRLLGVGLAAAAPTIVTQAARQFAKLAGTAGHMVPPTPAADGPGGADPGDQPGNAAEAGVLRALPSPQLLEPDVLGEFADNLGVRRPVDPDDLYREGPSPLELAYPLPTGLAALPWDSLSRRDRFFILVAAWALREADGIQLLRSGQPKQAGEAFKECLARAQTMQTPELAVRSCEDLGGLAVVMGDEAAARNWRAQAERMLRQ